MEAISNLSSDQKLDFLITTVLEMKAVLSKVAILEEKNKKLEATVSSLTRDVKQLKEMSNMREQQAKSNAVRLFGFPGSNDETGLAAKVYERILQPIFKAAKNKGDISSLPQVGTAVAEVFRAGKFSPGSNKPPPPLSSSNSPIRLIAWLSLKTSGTACRLRLRRRRRLAPRSSSLRMT
jgi:hypothetical protein